MRRNAPWIIAGAILLGAILHAGIPLVIGPRPQAPLHVGYVAGDIMVREGPNSTAKEQCNGCRVECYETFVLVYINRQKVPTWTDNYVLSIPWSKIEYMSLMPPGSSP
jgi:hypothetical protein